jgi:hypothetical protein
MGTGTEARPFFELVTQVANWSQSAKSKVVLTWEISSNYYLSAQLPRGEIKVDTFKVALFNRHCCSIYQVLSIVER